MRCHQYIGLTKKGNKFLADNIERIPNIVCHNCKTIINEKFNVLKTETQDAFYGDGPILRTYQLKDGRVAKEIVQVQPWSSGPMSFLCLEIEGQRHFEWQEVKGKDGEEVNYEEGTYWV